jgi:hypothetical protein
MSIDGRVLLGKPADKYPARILSLTDNGKLLSKWNPEFLRDLFEADAVEEIKVTILPFLLGCCESMSLSGMPDGFLSGDRYFRIKFMLQNKGSVTCHYVRNRRKRA